MTNLYKKTLYVKDPKTGKKVKTLSKKTLNRLDSRGPTKQKPPKKEPRESQAIFEIRQFAR